MSAMEDLRYHGPGFEASGDDWELMVWFPNDKRDHYAVNWESGFVETGELDDQGEPCHEPTVAAHERFTTASDAASFVSTLNKIGPRDRDLIVARIDVSNP